MLVNHAAAPLLYNSLKLLVDWYSNNKGNLADAISRAEIAIREAEIEEFKSKRKPESIINLINSIDTLTGVKCIGCSSTYTIQNKDGFVVGAKFDMQCPDCLSEFMVAVAFTAVSIPKGEA